MKIANFESLKDNNILGLVNSEFIEMTVTTNKLELQEDLNLRFSDGTEQYLPYGRNYRNTATNDVVVVEDSATGQLLFCGGLIAYVVSQGRICTTVETAYKVEPFPSLEYRQDFGEFQVFLVGSNIVLVWDYGVVIFDKEFNLIEKREKCADDILESTSVTQLIFKSSFDDEEFEIKLK